MEKGGVYALYNTRSGKAYIGQTKDLTRREKDHFRELKKGTHHNKHLQRAYAKYGEAAFQFVILERCPIEELDESEKKWISILETMNSDIGYNLESGGNVGKVVSEAVREAKRGVNNPMYGKHISEEHIEALRIKNRGHGSHLLESDVAEIKIMLLQGVSARELANRFETTTDVIFGIKSGKNWNWVRNDLNSELKARESNKKAERNRKILEMEREGISRAQIARELGCTPATVSRVIGKRSEYYLTSSSKSELKQMVINDYLNKVPRAEIMMKYEIDQNLYVKFISETYNEEKRKSREKAIELRKQGVMVKDIAEQLGVARTTISKWTKELQSCEYRDNHNN